ncbi:acyl-CoA dehydrogenase [Lentzea sp. NBRC 105346]|uniref:acyl-CoA dehydrogenase family protein n=1 Tax=Lentzea sp. NBRC 105346 TaxID=3032205 RepID=UPI0024A13E39|nr:acyl-CoA dehydrogenase family protein [Lentzea sp. NBRC 105346]GLZ28618.1 acyl-CoA dehydrogenase [Lentzea sp. NBRC 105346]
MDFTLDDTQREIARLTAQVLDREAGTPWKALREAGLLALPVPERLGGDGLGVLEVAVVLTEIGRRAADVPALAWASSVLPIARFGTPEQQDELLTGDLLVTVALSEPSAPLPSAPRTTARPDGERFLLSGTKICVPSATKADRILVTADRGVFVVDAADARISGSTVRLAETPGRLLGDVTSGALYLHALAAACALGDGVLAGALDLTVKHVGTRHQFGKPLSAFQSVACHVADVYIASRTLHLATIAGCLDPADLSTAAYWLAAEVLPAVHTCHHLHGGLGLDITYPMHRFYGMAKELTRFVGGVDHRLSVLAEEEHRVR